MGRLLSALLILLLAFSHGTLSAGVPHVDGAVHEHVLTDDHHGDHGAAASLDADAATPADDDGKAPHGMGHHVHVVGDSVPTADFVFADRALESERRLPVDDARLHSLALAPLPQPPSA